MKPSCDNCAHTYPNDVPCETCPDYENWVVDPDLDDEPKERDPDEWRDIKYDR